MDCLYELFLCAFGANRAYFTAEVVFLMVHHRLAFHGNYIIVQHGSTQDSTHNHIFYSRHIHVAICTTVTEAPVTDSFLYRIMQ